MVSVVFFCTSTVYYRQDRQTDRQTDRQARYLNTKICIATVKHGLHGLHDYLRFCKNKHLDSNYDVTLNVQLHLSFSAFRYWNV